MARISKTYNDFPADERDRVAAKLNPVARERFIAGKLDVEILEFRGEGLRTIERAIADKKRQIGEVFAPDAEALAWAKKWASESIIVIPDDLAA